MDPLSPRQQAMEVLAAAEHQLRKILADASLTAEFSELRELAAWAEVIREIPSGDFPARAGQGLRLTPDATIEAKRRTRPRRRSSKIPSTKSRGRSYPHFLRHGQDLIKIGWSKGKKCEYQQKAPWEALHALVDAIARAGTERARFTMDELLPIAGAKGSEFPSYQLYICMAWLRDERLVVQQGRQGYSLADARSLSAAVDERWPHLSVR